MKTKSISLIVTFMVLLLLTSCGGGGGTETISLIPVKSGDVWGYVDKEGKIKINPQFYNLSLFEDGLALVRATGDVALFGFIDENGKYVINPSYQQATTFSDGIAVVVAENEAPKAINKKGEVIFTLQTAERLQEFRGGMAGFSVSGEEEKQKWGFVDEKGQVKITPQFTEVRGFANDKAAVRNDTGKWGYTDKDGKLVINPQFDGAFDFYGGKAVVISGGKYGVIDEKGQYVINPQFNHIRQDGEKYLVASGNKFGWTDKEGKFIINPQFDQALPFMGNSLAPVANGRDWGYIDKEGKFVINPQFSEALPFNGSLAVVVSGTQVGFIDKKGSYIVNPQFDGIGGAYRSRLIKVQEMEGLSTVTTDYFDMDAIVGRIARDVTPNSIAGFSFANSTVGQMMEKYNRSSSDFSYYNGRNSLIENEKLGKFATITLDIGGSIYVQRGWGYIIDPTAKVDAFIYTIDLIGKASAKRKQLLEAFEKAFSGYAKQPSDDSARIMVASPTQHIIAGYKDYDTIMIVVKSGGVNPDTSLSVGDTTVVEN